MYNIFEYFSLNILIIHCKFFKNLIVVHCNLIVILYNQITSTLILTYFLDLNFLKSVFLLKEYLTME